MLAMKKILIAVLLAFISNTVYANICEQQQKIVEKNIKSLLPKVVGLSVAVYTLGKGACYFNYGTVRKHSKIKSSNQTICNLASLTKVFTRIILSVYAEKHWLNLYSPVKANLPAGYRLTPQEQTVTYQQLATFTGGFYYSEPPGFNLYNPPSQSQFVKSVSRLIPEKPIPGVKNLPSLRQYSNVSIGLLGQILMHIAAEKTGVRYPFTPLGYSSWVQRFLTNKIAMQTIAVHPKGNYSGLYRYSEKTKRISPQKAAPWFSGDGAAASLSSNSLNLVKFIHANLCATYPNQYNCSQYPSYLLSAMKRAQQVEHYRPKGSLKDSTIYVLNSHYKLLKIYKPYLAQALAWVLSPRKHILWKSGSSVGSSTWLGISPSKGMGVVILANTRVKDEVKFAGLNMLANMK